MNKAIFLDRDGTINEDKSFTYQIKDLKFIENSLEGLKKLQKLNFKLIIITNQSGIARGIYTQKDYFTFRDEMHKRLKEQGISIAAEYFCPHHPEKGYAGEIKKLKINCNCRKPKAGMLEKAAKDFDLILKK